MPALSVRFGGALTGLLMTLLLPTACVGGDQVLPPVGGRADLHGDPLPEGAIARLGTARFRHLNCTTLAFAPDGKTILTFGADHAIRHWDAATGRQLREQRVPNCQGSRNSRFSPDGKLLTFAEDRNNLALWDVSRHQTRHTLPHPSARFASALILRGLFTPDGKTLITVYDGVITAWDVETGRPRFLGRHATEISGQEVVMTCAADGTLLTAGAKADLRCWDLAQGRLRSEVTLPEHVGGAVLAPDGRTVASWSRYRNGPDRGVEFWDTAGRPAAGWTAPGVKKVVTVQFAPDGKTVLIRSGREAVVWDPAAGQARHTLTGVLAKNLAVSPNGKTLAAFGAYVSGSGYDGCLQVWDLTAGASPAARTSEHGHFQAVTGTAIAPDGRTVATASGWEGVVRLWDTATGRPVWSRTVPDLALYHSVAFARDGKELFVATGLAILRCEAATGREVGRLLPFEEGKEQSVQVGSALHVADDGRTLHALCGRQTGGRFLQSWDVATGRRVCSAPLPERFLDLMLDQGCFSADGRLFGHPGGTIYDAATGKEVLRLAAQGEELGLPVAFSPDGALFAAGTSKRTNGPQGVTVEMLGVQVWELATLLPVVRLETGEVRRGVITPDGRGFVAAGSSGLVRCDLATGHAIAHRPAQSEIPGTFGRSFASSNALATDGRTLVTAHPDSTALLWDLLTPTPKKAAAPLTLKDQEAFWAALASADAGRAQAALVQLADVPEQTAPWLQERIIPARAPSAEDLRQLITDLDAPQFDRRKKAAARLLELGEDAHTALRAALKGRLSEEARRRIESLLAEPPLTRLPEVRRHLRVVRLLEMIGNAEARAILEKLASGAPESRPTREAKAALGRLERRP